MVPMAIWPELSTTKTKLMLEVNRRSLQLSIGVVTDHCSIRLMTRITADYVARIGTMWPLPTKPTNELDEK